MDDPEAGPQSALPYVAWTEDALREVMLRALEHVVREGLPDPHHFYITFRTAAPRVVLPARVLARFPHEMTIVLQHQFWDLEVDRAERQFSVGLSFGGIRSVLVIPFGAVTSFADPYVQFQLQFEPLPDEVPDNAIEDAPAEPEPATEPEAPAAVPQVVSLDAFRRRTPKE